MRLRFWRIPVGTRVTETEFGHMVHFDHVQNMRPGDLLFHTWPDQDTYCVRQRWLWLEELHNFVKETWSDRGQRH
jgi:hypothetical protein